MLNISYDHKKNESNQKKHGVSFEQLADFDFERAAYWVDDRKNYGEKRLVAIGYLAERIHVLCFTETNDGIRAITFRKANRREVTKYEQAQTPNK